MVAPISSLQNMEMQLYGGIGNSMSLAYNNNYMGSMNYNMGYGMPYGNQNFSNVNFGQLPQQYASAGVQQGQNMPFNGLSQRETKALTDYYAKGLAPSEGLVGAALGQAAFAVLNHPRLIVHPWNSIKATGPTEKIFAGIKDATSNLGKLWADKETNGLIREAYMQYHKAEARLNPKFKLGLFRDKFSKNPENQKIVKGLMEDLEKALKNGSKDDIANVTAKLQQSYVNDGAWFKGVNWVKQKLGMKDAKVPTVAEALADKKALGDKVVKLTKDVPDNFVQHLKHGQGIGGALLFAGFELVLGWGKIKKCFARDKENEAQGVSTNLGWKQVAQTAVKGLGSGIGWAIGDAAALTAFGKWGARLGTMFGPGVGTAIGGIVGVVGGGIGLWLAGKCTKALVGQDVGDQVEAEELAKTNEGQTQLLQYTLQQAQKGKAIPVEVQQAAMKVASQFA